MAVLAVPVACQYSSEAAAKQARAHAIDNAVSSAKSILLEMNSDPAVKNADPAVAAKNAARYLSPPHPADAVVNSPGFELRTQFDEPWQSMNQEHRIRLCLSYVSSDAGSAPILLVDRPCPSDVFFVPGLDEVVKLTG
ncbi:hypothetical protein [Amycolatopsis sp. NPDC098790]|uniref:hypothetical protein n=1 Tax=Amycolatopsis sp. NPDC098790 TaxID=3363939 RepID=UPI00382102AB